VLDVDLEHLPRNIDQSHRLILELLAERRNFVQAQAEHERVLAEQQRSLQELHEQYELLRQLHYGRSSEKLEPEDRRQMRLFNEAESGVQEIRVLTAEQAGSVPVAQHVRNRPRGRKPLAERLPRDVVIHDVSEEQKRCRCCGKDRPLVSEEASEEAEIIPAKIHVIRHLRRVYGPCSCAAFADCGEPTMIRSPMPPRMIPGSIAAPGLLAYVLTAKFVDALPFYRQETIFARLGIEVSRATLCGWTLAVGRALEPLVQLMWQKLHEAPLVQMDETTLQVLHQPGRAKPGLSYMWVNIASLEDANSDKLKRLVLFHYHPSRSADVPLAVLKDYQGYLQTDGYAGYEEIGTQPLIIHVGCWAHARRFFHKASKITKKAGAADEALRFIAELYRTEATLRELLAKEALSRAQFVERRAELAGSILARFRVWLQERIERVPPKTALGEALHYTLAQWPRLERYLDAWFLTPDNNVAENAIRPFVVGRKNFLFADTARGAHASAAIYSMVESAKANELEPYHYLRYLFTKLPAATTTEDYERLLPTSLSPKNLLELDSAPQPP